MLIAALALSLAASPADDQRAEVERAAFELCPRVMAGTLALGDAAQAQAAGYTTTGPRQTPAGPVPRAQRGEGTDRIVIAGSGGERAICSVWFGGPENRRLSNHVRDRAPRHGFRGGGAPMRLGDGTRIHMLRRSGEQAATLALFEADAGGELDFEPATTIVIMGGTD